MIGEAPKVILDEIILDEHKHFSGRVAAGVLKWKHDGCSYVGEATIDEGNATVRISRSQRVFVPENDSKLSKYEPPYTEEEYELQVHVDGVLAMKHRHYAYVKNNKRIGAMLHYNYAQSIYYIAEEAYARCRSRPAASRSYQAAAR